MNAKTGADFNFPFEAYDIQLQLMSNIDHVLQERRIGVFSSPTGTGKSLSLICATLTWLKKHRESVKNDTSKAFNELVDSLKSMEAQGNGDWISLHSKKVEKNEEKLRLESELQKIEQFDNRNKELKEKQKSNILVSKKVDYSNKKPKVIENDDELCDDLLLNYDSDDGTKDDVIEKEEKCNTIKPMIIYCSRTHSQLSQFVSEVKSTIFKNDIRLVTLGSRSNLCVHPAFSKLKDNNVLNEKCLDLQKKSSKCPYYKQAVINEVRDEILGAVHDIEDIALMGRQVKACSFYASKSAALEAEILVVPYNVLLHKQTRKSYGIDLKENIVIVDEAHNLLETITSIHSAFINGGQIIDCHSKLSQYLLRYNTRLSPKNLMYVKQLIFILGALLKPLKPGAKDESQVLPTVEFIVKNGFDNINLFKLLNYCDVSQIARKLHAFTSTMQEVTFDKKGELENSIVKSGTNAFLAKMKAQQMAMKKGSKKGGSNSSTKVMKLKKEVDVTVLAKSDDTMTEKSQNEFVGSSSLYPVIDFIRALTNVVGDGRIVVTRNVKSIRESSLKFLLLNPSNQFKEIVDESRSVILVGGTMEPFSEFIDHLFKPIGVNVDRITCFSCGHVIPDNNLLAIGFGCGPTANIPLDFSFKSRNDLKVILETGRVISKLCSVIPGGVIVFFPSYEYEDRVHSLWLKNGFIKNFESTGKRVYRESRQSSCVNGILSDYKRSVHMAKGALLLSVVGGKMSEGINFADDLGRAVVVVGLPFANITSPEIKEKMSFYDSIKSGEGQKYYLNACMKAVNQSIGRVIRHSRDYAAIILVDVRYTNRQDISSSLASWIQQKFRKMNDFDSSISIVNSFFKRLHYNK